MTSMLLPDWLRIVWVVALVAVIATHIWHASCRPGQHRWWHAGHVLTAAGMVVMYLPGLMSGLSWDGVVLFGGVALVTAAAAAALRNQQGALNPLWVTSAVDALIMAYMWLPGAIRPSLLDYALAAYLGCQMLAWLLGLWERAAVVDRPKTPAMAAGGAAKQALVRTRPAPSAVVGLVVHCTPLVRASLAVMAASMSYMLIVM